MKAKSNKSKRYYSRIHALVVTAVLCSILSCGEASKNSSALLGVSAADPNAAAVISTPGIPGDCAIFNANTNRKLCKSATFTLNKAHIFVREITTDSSLSLVWGTPEVASLPLDRFEYYIGYTTATGLDLKSISFDTLIKDPSMVTLSEWKKLNTNEFPINIDELLGNEREKDSYNFNFVVGVRDNASTIFFNILEYSWSTKEAVTPKITAPPTATRSPTPIKNNVVSTIINAPEEADKEAPGSFEVFTIDNKAISKTARSTTSVTLTWAAAAPAHSFEYKILVAESTEAIDTFAEAVQYASTGLWMSDTFQQTVNDLTPKTTYGFNILARDSEGKYALYQAASFRTLGVGECDLSGEVFHKVSQSCLKKIEPSDVPYRLLHLDASALTLADQDQVTNWPDLSGKKKHFSGSTCTNLPVYNASGLNSKPSVKFNGSILFNNSLDLREETYPKLVMLIVYRYTGDRAIWTLGQNGFTKRQLFGYSSPYVQISRVILDQKNNSKSTSIDGDVLSSTTTSFSGSNISMALGTGLYAWDNYCGAYYSNMDLGEILLLDGSQFANNDEKLLRLEIYLSQKWGVSLVN